MAQKTITLQNLISEAQAFHRTDDIQLFIYVESTKEQYPINDIEFGAGGMLLISDIKTPKSTGRKGGKPRSNEADISDHAKYMRKYRAKNKLNNS